MSTTESPDQNEATGLTNKSVIKAMALLQELGCHPTGITSTELAHRLGMTRPTAFRLLLSMEQTGFVQRVDNNYTLGWEIAKLGRIADPSGGVAAKVQPTLDTLAHEINESASFALNKGSGDYDIIAEANALRMLQVSDLYVHRHFPLHASATGKILLSDLSDERILEVLPDPLERYTGETLTDRADLLKEIAVVRQQGYATLDNELEEGLVAVAVPCVVKEDCCSASSQPSVLNA